MEADVTSGKMTVESSRADALTVEVTSGSAAFGGAFRNISGEATSGTVRIATDVLPDTLDGNVTSGKVSFTIPDNDGFPSTVKTSGSLRSNFDLMSSVNGDKNQYSYGSAARPIPAKGDQRHAGNPEKKNEWASAPPEHRRRTVWTVPPACVLSEPVGFPFIDHRRHLPRLLP